jgi:glucose-1-phosphate cytidylyltransferase
MKVIILAGGLGTRISEETQDKPKPMVQINGVPILQHIMEIYQAFGFHEFVIAIGYKGEVINSWLSGNLESPKVIAKGFKREFELVLRSGAVKVTTVETGVESLTGERLRVCLETFEDTCFMGTYGDGVGNINIFNLVENFGRLEKAILITAVHPPARFGYLKLEGEFVTEFGEKNPADAGWINGGFFIFNRDILHYFEGENESLENDILPRLAADKNFAAYRHSGFWQPMDTLREKIMLEELAGQSPPPWLEF